VEGATVISLQETFMPGAPKRSRGTIVMPTDGVTLEGEPVAPGHYLCQRVHVGNRAAEMMLSFQVVEADNTPCQTNRDGIWFFANASAVCKLIGWEWIDPNPPQADPQA